MWWCGCHCHQQRCSKVRQSALWESYPPACYLCCDDRHRTEILSSPVGPSRTAIRADSKSTAWYEPARIFTRTAFEQFDTTAVHQAYQVCHDAHHQHIVMAFFRCYIAHALFLVERLLALKRTNKTTVPAHVLSDRQLRTGCRITLRLGAERKLTLAIVRSEKSEGRWITAGTRADMCLKPCQTPEFGFPQWAILGDVRCRR